MRYDGMPDNGYRLGGHENHRGTRCLAFAIVLVISVAACLVQAPPAAADFVDNLRDAVTQARSNACGSSHPDAIADQTAAFVAKSTESYLNHTARAVPIADPLPELHDLGSNAGKATLMQGIGKTEAEAIKFVLTEGYKDLPDCSYTSFGVSALPNTNLGGWYLTALVLAGP
jgi:hypothetical protein